MKGGNIMLVDYHTHTEFSDDSIYLMEKVIKDAIAMGMKEICFTDHVDYGIKQDWDSGNVIEYRNGEPLANVDYPNYVAKIKELQEIYQNQINIKMGLEFGIQMHTIPQYETLFQKYPFDFIILSIHQVENKEFWTQDFQKGKTQQEYNERYYQEMLDVIKNYKNYSVLGHIDLITRYDKQGVYPFEKIKPILEKILKIVIADGKGIEFNTSFHRYHLKDTTPCMEILKLYHELGGTIITLGSDSHKPEHLGAYMQEAKTILKALGFTKYCTYQNMQPIFHQIEDV